jgi:hypothetical protein
MNTQSNRALQLLALSLICLLFGPGILLLRHQSLAAQQPVPAPVKPVDPPGELAALRAEIEQLKGKVPDQSHAMKDVGYHFANLWFAGQKRNWPLAKFYLDETRSHLKWAVRIIPIRKTKAGEVDLRGVLEAVDNSMLSEIQKAIEKQDVKKFGDTYKQTIEGCYSCHKASEKPYLRPQIPEQPEARIINFDPEAKWPE